MKSKKEVKAISSVIGTLLVLVITIGLFGFSYSFITGVFTSKTSQTFSVVDAYQDTLTIVNSGTEGIKGIRATEYGNPVDLLISPATILPGQTATVKPLSALSEGRHTLRLCTSTMCQPAIIIISYVWTTVVSPASPPPPRRPVDVFNPGVPLTNYQVKITLDTAALISAGKMRSDCGDLRVTDSDGTTMQSHWLENGCNSSATNIWTRVPSLPGNATKTIYAYYGNSSLTSTSNFASTFPNRYILTSGTVTSTGAQNYDWFEVKSGATFTITDGTAQSITARKILIAGTVNGVGLGFAGASPVGIGLGPGGGSYKSGGAYGGAGGQGCTSAWGVGGVPGSPYGSASSQAIEMGSGGGASDSIQAPGGDGGGAVTFKSAEIVVSGTVTMNGEGKGTGTNQNGGGAAGGILMLSSRVNLSGALSANGGAGDVGGVRSGGAGGGGGGRIKIFSDKSISDTSTKNVIGGSGSPGGTNGGSFCPGTAGAPGTTFTGTFTSLEPTTTVGPEN